MTAAGTLSIQPARTVIVAAGDEFVIGVGTDAIAALFRRAVPSGSEIEAAINVVEDAIGRAGKVPAGASLASGAPRMPPGPQFAATLLILRELMHHLQVRELRLLP